MSSIDGPAVCSPETRAMAGSAGSAGSDHAFPFYREAGTEPASGSHHACMEGLTGIHLGVALAGALALSVWMFGRARGGPRTRGWRFDLLSIPWVRRLVEWRGFQPLLQAFPLLLFMAVIVSGIWGTPVPERNLATVLTWGIWWVLLIVDIVLLGRMWCLVCPWEAIAGGLRRLGFMTRGDEPLALDNPWPQRLRNVYPATLLFLVLTWMELGWGVTFSPRATAWLGLGMLCMAVLGALLFEKRAFCKYGCLVGRICGLYAMLAPVEVRAADPEVCTRCRTKDCVFGNADGYPCPTSQYPAKMDTNAYCTVCTECVKSCPHGNVALNLRPWGSDLELFSRPRSDEAVLAVVMLAMTSFHGLTMTPTWNDALDAVRRGLGVSQLAAFSSGMVVVLALPVLAFAGFAWLAARHGAEPAERRTFVASIAYPLVAIALFYHLAHNAGHFLVEGSRIVAVVSDPLGRGWDLFGTASFVPRPLLPMPAIWMLQIGLVLLGHGLATGAALHVTERYRGEDSWTARYVVTVMLLLFTAVNLWLLAQPMEMRTGL